MVHRREVMIAGTSVVAALAGCSGVGDVIGGSDEIDAESEILEYAGQDDLEIISHRIIPGEDGGIEIIIRVENTHEDFDYRIIPYVTLYDGDVELDTISGFTFEDIAAGSAKEFNYEARQDPESITRYELGMDVWDTPGSIFD